MLEGVLGVFEESHFVVGGALRRRELQGRGGKDSETGEVRFAFHRPDATKNLDGIAAIAGVGSTARCRPRRLSPWRLETAATHIFNDDNLAQKPNQNSNNGFLQI